MQNKQNHKKLILVIVITILVVAIAAIATIILLLSNKSESEIIEPSGRCMRYDEAGKCLDYVSDKPIIYLYPEQETEVTVSLGRPEKLYTTYPEYSQSWRVLARPSGNLTDLSTGRKYYALYWEGNDYPAKVHETGFIVRGTDTVSFLEEKLTVLGLSEREANEFIIYWLPKMQHNAYNYIYFSTAEEIDDYMPLEVNPRPDSIIRVMMEFKPLEQSFAIKEQELSTPERRGFTVVEWGGSIIAD